MSARLIAFVCALAAIAATNASFARRAPFLADSAAAGQQTGAHPDANASSPPADPPEVRFTGEVLRGQIYEHDIGHDLIFRLTPAVSDEGGGWVIGILPATEPSDESVEFVEIATPPYHSYNERYLAAASGYSAREALAITKRKFYFVQSVADEHVANEVVNAALYPSAVSEAERGRIAGEAADLHLGSG